MEVEQQLSTWEGYVNWKNKPALRGGHGGLRAASFVLVVEVLENLAYLANASNLVTYMSDYMHLSPSKSANTVTNFMGTAFLLALLGGFLSDAFFSTYFIYLISAFIQFLVHILEDIKEGETSFMTINDRGEENSDARNLHFIMPSGYRLFVQGLVILAVQAHSSSLKPPKCEQNIPCQEVHGLKAAMLFIGLYLVALGVGGIKGSLPAHGAEQFDENTVHGRKQRSTFFNYFVFCLSCGGLIAVTFVVWIEDNKGWQWGFFISTITILLSIPIFLLGSPYYRNKIPYGSPLTTIAKVVLTALLNSSDSNNAVTSMASASPSPCPLNDGDNGRMMRKTLEDTVKISPVLEKDCLRYLNRAVTNNPKFTALSCTVQQVEDVKIVIKMLPIFACTIMLNCCLAQLSTFSVQQAATMNTKLGSLKVPPASLPIFPVVFIMILAPTYDHFIIPFLRRVTKTETGITHLQRIGIGLVLSVVAMAVAALVEIKRKRVAIDHGLLDDSTDRQSLPITFFWIAFQFLFLGSADLFTLAGLLEFFFTEAPISMRSLATSLSWASLAMGYYLSTVIVSLVHSATGYSNHKPWLSGSNLNHYHLDRFYWLMCVLSGVNFFHYLFWAIPYKYRSINRNQY